jgi:hypothetical protein
MVEMSETTLESVLSTVEALKAVMSSNFIVEDTLTDAFVFNRSWLSTEPNEMPSKMRFNNSSKSKGSHHHVGYDSVCAHESDYC